MTPEDNDDCSLLIYADWLTDNGDEQAAEQLRDDVAIPTDADPEYFINWYAVGWREVVGEHGAAGVAWLTNYPNAFPERSKINQPGTNVANKARRHNCKQPNALLRLAAGLVPAAFLHFRQKPGNIP